MRLSLAVVLSFACTGFALADTPRQLDRGSRTLVSPPVADCREQRMEHARGVSPTRLQRLGALPAAWRLHAVNRRVNGCTVHPEAQKVSDSTGRLAAEHFGRR
jgi:hypothetical protein